VGILSNSVSITRYRVDGQIEAPVMETLLSGLKKNAIQEIDQETTEKAMGWTSIEKPFFPEFEGDSVVIGPYILFSLRIDTKRVSQKVVQKFVAVETARKLADSGRNFLSREEKRMLKDHVTNMLYKRVPAIPSIYDILWHLEQGYLWFFSNQKAANEAVETLFLKSFNLTLVPLFPYTCALSDAGLSPAQQDILSTLSPASFVE